MMMMGAATKIKLKSTPRAAILLPVKLIRLAMTPKRHPRTTRLPPVPGMEATTATTAAALRIAEVTSFETLIRRPWLLS